MLSPRLYRLLVIKRLRRGRAHAGIGSPILQLRCLARTVVWRDCSEIAKLRKRCLAPDFAVAIRDLSSHRCDLQTNAEPQQFFRRFHRGLVPTTCSFQYPEENVRDQSFSHLEALIDVRPDTNFTPSAPWPRGSATASLDAIWNNPRRRMLGNPTPWRIANVHAQQAPAIHRPRFGA